VTKFHYTSWFGASSDPASVMEFGFYSLFASTNNTSEDCTVHYTSVLIIVVIIISTSDTTSKWRSLAITFTGALPRALCQSFNFNVKCRDANADMYETDYDTK